MATTTFSTIFENSRVSVTSNNVDQNDFSSVFEAIKDNIIIDENPKPKDVHQINKEYQDFDKTHYGLQSTKRRKKA